MGYNIVVTENADRDLEEVLDYIIHALGNPSAAANLLKKTEECCEQLRRFPFLYETCRSPRLRESGYRRAVVDNYILVYHPVEKEHTVYVLRFFYGGMEYEKLI